MAQDPSQRNEDVKKQGHLRVFMLCLTTGRKFWKIMIGPRVRAKWGNWGTLSKACLLRFFWASLCLWRTGFSSPLGMGQAPIP